MVENKKGQIFHKGKFYLRPSYAGRLMGVSGFTVTRWFREGKIPGVLLPAKMGKKNVLYVDKSSLNKTIFQYKCMTCGKTVSSKRVRNPNNKQFCSDKCCYKWWNQYCPVDSKGKRRKSL